MLMGMSLVQKGSGFPFFVPCVYAYLIGTDVCSITVGQDEIPDPEVKEVLQKVNLVECLAFWSEHS